MKHIKRKSVVKPITGQIVDTRNVDDKTTNALSIAQMEKENTYSLKETFTGQYWIDGKPIYRKVLTAESYVSSITDEELKNVDEIVDRRGSWVLASNESRSFPTIYPPNMSGYGVDLYSLTISTGTLSINWGTTLLEYNKNNISKIRIILEYTKTTDL